MNVNGLLMGVKAFFHNPKYDDIHDSSFENFWKAYIGIMCKFTLVAIKCTRRTCYFKNFVCVNACPPPTGGERSTQKQRMFVSMLCTTKQHVLNIQLTDMWYLDISSLALTYIYLSRTNNNFWHWSAQEELKPSQILWLIFKKNHWSQKLSDVFSRSYRTKKWFLDRINSVPGRPWCNSFCRVANQSQVYHHCNFQLFLFNEFLQWLLRLNHLGL